MPVSVYDPVAYLELSTHKVVMSTNYTCPADCDAIYNRMKANTNGGSRAAKVTDNIRKMIGVLAKNIQSISGASAEQSRDIDNVRMIAAVVDDVMGAIAKDDKMSEAFAKTAMKMVKSVPKGFFFFFQKEVILMK